MFQRDFEYHMLCYSDVVYTNRSWTRSRDGELRYAKHLAVVRGSSAHISNCRLRLARVHDDISERFCDPLDTDNPI